MSTRSDLRKQVMVTLYQVFLYEKNNFEFDLKDLIKDNIKNDDPFACLIINGVLEHINDIDKIANKNLSNWSIDRLGQTDQAILRMGIFELLYTDTPEIVAINEAVELSKKFSDNDVYKMINGVLDKIYKGK